MKKLSAFISVLLLVGMLFASACSAARPNPIISNQGIDGNASVPGATAAPSTSYRPPAATLAPGTTRPAAPAPTTVPRPAYPAAPPAPYPPSASGGSGPNYPPSPTGGTIGLAVGGAKDVNNFRDNIRNNYLPLPTDITYEGLYYDYYFNTGATQPTNKLFAPSYSTAVTRDPLSGQTEYYLSVGLNSGLKEEDFQRKKLNLVIVLDTSGSMGEQFNQYYYDGSGRPVDVYAEEGIQRLRKIDSAQDAVVSILNQLHADDRFAIVTFNSSASLMKPMGLVNRTDMKYTSNRIYDLTAGGSTNLDAGMDMATAQLRGVFTASSYEYENRIIVLTDAEPNTGDISVSGLMNNVTKNAAGRIYTTFIGIGVDFNTQLMELITKTKGDNYYAVHSPREFRQRMNEEFDFMVTPMVFNVNLNFESQGWKIEKVFGSPEADQSTGTLMHINTLFPSKTEGGETKGGLVLLKLRRISASAQSTIYLRTTYEDRNGRRDGSESVITLESMQPEYFDNTGIQKGVLLARYAALLKNWTIDQRQHVRYSSSWNPIIDERSGIVIPVENAGQWERTSQTLMVSPGYQRVFANFESYFQQQMTSIGDDDLRQEIAILDRLSR